jgi:hypothetical protein
MQRLRQAGTKLARWLGDSKFNLTWDTMALTEVELSTTPHFPVPACRRALPAIPTIHTSNECMCAAVSEHHMRSTVMDDGSCTRYMRLSSEQLFLSCDPPVFTKMPARSALSRAESLSSTPASNALPLDLPEEISDESSIPWRPLVPIILYRVADAAMYSVIFPFVADMITSLNAPTDKVGLYAGLAEGSLMIVEAVVAPLAAKAGDSFGRRPTTILGFLPCIVASILVGFSRTVWQVILWRGLSEWETLSGTLEAIALMTSGDEPLRSYREIPVLRDLESQQQGQSLCDLLSFLFGRLHGRSCVGRAAHPRLWPFAVVARGRDGTLEDMAVRPALPRFRLPVSVSDAESNAQERAGSTVDAQGHASHRHCDSPPSRDSYTYGGRCET